MVTKAQYDFLDYVSFPSSGKLVNDGTEGRVYIGWYPQRVRLAVNPDATLKVEYNAKGQNTVYGSHVSIDGWNGTEWRRLINIPPKLLPLGSFDWRVISESFKIPPDVTVIGYQPSAGAGDRATPGITWFDDLKIYQNGVPIYENKFSNWAPIIIPAEIITGVAMIKYLK